MEDGNHMIWFKFEQDPSAEKPIVDEMLNLNDELCYNRIRFTAVVNRAEA